MSIADLFILFGGLIFIIVLLRISQEHGSDPLKRIKLHEDMGVQFPPGSSFEDKQRLLDLYGIVPGGIERPLLIIVVVIVLGFYFFRF